MEQGLVITPSAVDPGEGLEHLGSMHCGSPNTSPPWKHQIMSCFHDIDPSALQIY